MSETLGVRKGARSSLDARISLSWEDSQGVPRFSRGRCVDISERGLGVLLDVEVPLRSYVNFRIEELGFAGTGSVRSVRYKGLQYLVGLEFAGTLLWEQISVPVRSRTQ